VLRQLHRGWRRSRFAAGHFLLELLLFGAIVFLLLQRSYKPDKKPLTERVRTVAGARERGAVAFA
jgi:hypothetical protein